MRRLLLALCLSLLSMVALADREGYHFEAWTVNATVAKDNTWTIHEQYDVVFDEPRHGIYRYIDRSFVAPRNVAADGEAADVRSMRYASTLYILGANGAEWVDYDSEDTDSRIVRYGSADYCVTGSHSYTLDYIYRYSDDRVEARDYLFHTLLPDFVNVPVGVFRFDISFEKPLPDDVAARLKVYTSAYGGQEAGNTGVEDLTVTPTRISGTVRNTGFGQNVTLYAELPQGYYEGAETVSRTPFYVCLLVALALIALMLYYELLRPQQPVATVMEYYPPEGVTPSEVGTIIDDSADIIDLTALVPWLAKRGYLTIEEVERRGLFMKKDPDIRLVKVKDLPEDAPRYQHRIMRMLFDGETSVLMSEIGRRPEAVKDAKEALATWFTGPRKLSDFRYIGWMVALILSSSLAYWFSSPVKMYDTMLLYFVAPCWTLTFAVAYGLRMLMSAKDAFRKPLKTLAARVLRVIGFLMAMGILYLLMVTEVGQDVNYMALSLMSIGCFAVCELAGRTRFDTEYRRSLKGRLLGFKRFIETAEVHRLRQLVDEDPAYFYEVLPYAMVFELTDKWVSQFKDIKMQQADWYQSCTPNLYSYAYIDSLSHAMNTTVGNAITTSSHAANSGSIGSLGGGFSGGGFAGGGGGGGGAGSW